MKGHALASRLTALEKVAGSPGKGRWEPSLREIIHASMYEDYEMQADVFVPWGEKSCGELILETIDQPPKPELTRREQPPPLGEER